MARFLHPKALRLRNFKGIADLDLTLDESLTLLAGVNGVGKTSVIQALLAAVTHAWQHIPPHDYPIFGFSESVLRAARRARNSDWNSAYQTSLQSQCGSKFGSTICTSTRSKNCRWHGVSVRSSHRFLCSYTTNRIASPRSDSNGYAVSFSSKENRDSSLHTTIYSPPEFRAWFFEKEADEGQEIRERQDLKYTDPSLQPSGNCSNNWTGLRPFDHESRTRTADGRCFWRKTEPTSPSIHSPAASKRFSCWLRIWPAA